MSEVVVGMVVAAGSGVRYGGVTPKPLLEIDQRPAVVMAAQEMAKAGCEELVVVTRVDLLVAIAALFEDFEVPTTVVAGGATRQESVRNGLAAFNQVPDTAIVLVHDAARPMMPARVIAAVAQAVEGGAAAVAPVTPVSDSIRQIGADGLTEVVDRSRLRAIQTPQGFRFGELSAAHHHWADLEFTDDLSVCEADGHRVVLVPGSRWGMKITEPGDLEVARTLWAHRGDLAAEGIS